MEGLGQFLSSNLRYPASAQRERIQGRVFVSFVVCEDGSLCDYEVLKGIHPDVDEEALRVTKIMNGHWKPGIQRGKKVKVKYNLPINFSLH
ncbi:energy transducer TonB [Spirosoma sp. KUDC1026]|nr:energy transducer TonB [Spirosoma sp. KUDC1026]